MQLDEVVGRDVSDYSLEVAVGDRPKLTHWRCGRKIGLAIQQILLRTPTRPILYENVTGGISTCAIPPVLA